MQIRLEAWRKYIVTLRKCSDEAADRFAVYLYTHDISTKAAQAAAIAYANALTTRYGEGAAAAACEMYDAVAAASGVTLPAAEPAETASYHEVAKAVNGTLKQTQQPEAVSGAVGRLVKLAGVDTTMQNALRDGAEWAWVPSGDTCAFCLALSSRGWQRASKAALKNGHAEHVHANCDCTYAVRFDSSTQVAGYDPTRYRQLYETAPGSSPAAKINALRREFYTENRDKINAQKRSAYARRQALNSSAAEELDVE